MNGLGMLDEKNEAFKYKLVIVLCADWSRETTHGSKFIIERVNEPTIKKIDTTLIDKTDKSKTVKEKMIFDNFTLQEWQENDKTDMARKIETIIARVCYYPNLEKVVLQK
jgi:hypothetical protein